MKKEKIERKTDWVDVHNDALMVELGFRQPPLEPRDPSVWTKSPEEKKKLLNLKHRFKSKFSANWGYTPSEIPVYDKLIVYIQKSPKYTIVDSNKKVYKTTFSYKCSQSRIPTILASFKRANAVVTKYYWNGRTYSPTELPYWKR